MRPWGPPAFRRRRTCTTERHGKPVIVVLCTPSPHPESGYARLRTTAWRRGGRLRPGRGSCAGRSAAFIRRQLTLLVPVAARVHRQPVPRLPYHHAFGRRHRKDTSRRMKAGPRTGHSTRAHCYPHTATRRRAASRARSSRARSGARWGATPQTRCPTRALAGTISARHGHGVRLERHLRHLELHTDRVGGDQVARCQRAEAEAACVDAKGHHGAGRNSRRVRRGHPDGPSMGPDRNLGAGIGSWVHRAHGAWTTCARTSTTTWRASRRARRAQASGSRKGPGKTSGSCLTSHWGPASDGASRIGPAPVRGPNVGGRRPRSTAPKT